MPDRDFNQTIDSLPQNLTHLALGTSFNQSVDLLPNLITHLSFGGNFNQIIETLPQSVKELGICAGCRSNIVNNIPENIKTIKINFSVNDKLNSKITNPPPTINKIIIKIPAKLCFIQKIPFRCVVVDTNDKVMYKIEKG